MRTADIVPPGAYEIKAQADIIFDSKITSTGGGGFNLSPHFVTGLIEHYLDIDAFFGVGTTDFQIGAQAKFNLLPDVPGQAALAFIGGFSLLKDSINDESQTGVLTTLGVLLSKKAEWNADTVIPYLGYEFEILAVDGPNKLPHTLILGTKWKPTTVDPWSFYGELAVGLHRSIYALSVGASQSF